MVLSKNHNFRAIFNAVFSIDLLHLNEIFQNNLTQFLTLALPACGLYLLAEGEKAFIKTEITSPGIVIICERSLMTTPCMTSHHVTLHHVTLHQPVHRRTGSDPKMTHVPCLMSTFAVTPTNWTYTMLSTLLALG